MTRVQYQRLAEPFQKSKGLRRLLIYTDAVLTGLTYLAYPALLLALLLQHDLRLWRCVFVPAVSFLAVSGMRKLINAKRPLEVLHIRPILHKEKCGESFPSRHVFSIFVLAMTFYYVFVPGGIVLTLFGVLLAVARVIGGVHFPRDVLAGAAIGILCGALGFLL